MSASITPSRVGLSLVEVMIAMAILVVGLMSLMGAMGTANEVKNRAKSTGLALTAAQAEVEQLQALSFNEVVSKVPLAPSGLAFAVSGLRLQTGATTAGSVSRQLDSTPNLIHLLVTLNWQDIQGPASINIHYYHANRGS